MDAKQIMKIFEETAYVRTGGSSEELRCAEYLRSKCAEIGLKAEILPFDVDMATMKRAEFYADGAEIPCKGYLCAGSGEVEAPLYYLRGTDPLSLSQCRGKRMTAMGEFCENYGEKWGKSIKNIENWTKNGFGV